MSKHRAIKKHHAKPVRKRHLSVGAIGLCLVVIASYSLGFGSSRIFEAAGVETTTSASQTSETIVSSSYGFRVPVDLNTYDISGTKIVNSEAVAFTATSIGQAEDIVAVSFSPKQGRIESAQLGSTINVRISTDTPAYQAALNAEQQEPLRAAARLFRSDVATSQTRTLLSSTEEQLSGLKMQKEVYEIRTNLGGELTDARTYEVVYVGVVGQKPISIRISGLVGGSALPSQYVAFLDAIRFNSDLGGSFEPISFSLPGFGTASAAAIDDLDTKYLADLTSPSVVKIYNGVCGRIQFNGSVGQNEVCSGGSGSGFFLTSDGHIATNGHVVVLEAEDLLAEVFLSDSSVFVEYLRFNGLSDFDINRVLTEPERASAAIASIYDEPDDTFSLTDEQRRILVAVSDDALDTTDIGSFFAKRETKTIKEARLIDFDYSARDVYALGVDGGEFSASDVALIQIDLDDTPALPLATNEPIQNEPIIVLGFPGDAENALVDNDELAISVTNGAVSSIRSAVGGGKLYQSDADASSGNSGGPAINDRSEVIGLVTYRFNDGEVTNASKTYIRDIADLRELAEKNGIELDSQSSTYDVWLDGLNLYSQNKFKAAQTEFTSVEEDYPAHRLVDSYQARAGQAIAEGRNIDDFPVLAASMIGLAGTLMLALGIVLTARHNHNHRRHLLRQSQSRQNDDRVNHIHRGHHLA